MVSRSRSMRRTVPPTIASGNDRFSGTSAMVVRVACGHHRTDRLVVACRHGPVDDLVVAAVPTDRDEQRTAGGGGSPGQDAGMPRVLGGGHRDRDARNARGQLGAQLLGQLGRITRALRIEDHGDPVEGPHQRIVLTTASPRPIEIKWL
jgi:hypothetical protein